ncbi:ubiquitin carboxyl-terminal hydrolase 8 [Sitodiplosis mosellana]|uniref:ubiquitin carboxyl-terminal hydrolase 8 n=1 Tax=Sitodiplosis mosellana TaxID=263140 RepID=UPI002443D92D|nr:ubiquitin carboxyl-terminal hydrolase 8 [Sitodiplosis mosellana]
MPRSPIPLCVADNVQRLNEMAEVGKEIKRKQTLLLSKSTQKVLAKAEEFYKLGDEEQAYIMYMKYFALIEIIRNAKDFSKVKGAVKELLGGNKDIFARMDLLEELKDSLLKRYAERKKLFEAAQHKAEQEKKMVTANETASVPVTKFLSCTNLYNIIKNTEQHTLLLIDCRSSDDFLGSQIRYQNSINIPGDTIKHGTSAWLLSREIAPNRQSLWNARDKMDLVVLIDEDTSDSKSTSTNTSKPIWTLRNILLNWDPDMQYKSVLLLDGGFQKFGLVYPMWVTNPKYKPKSTDAPAIPAVSDIEYPNLGDIKMKPKPTEQPSSNVPRIDRSNKPIFGQKSIEQQQPINSVSIVQEREKILDQILQKDREALRIGDELSNIVNAPIKQSEAEHDEWLTKQTELEYKLVQKENELNDTIMELSTITTPELENKLQFDTSNPDVKKIVARIEEKSNEHAEYERRMKQRFQEIEEKRRTAREQQKRHLQLKEEEEELIRPKQPAFDRSVKPASDNLQMRFPQIHRNFEPVYGSYGDIGATGLKNLGNTCYMNSIIQCILNLETFCEYLKRDGYLKHVNRKSKTHGQITEELAQLCKELWSGKYKSVAPRDFRNVIGQEHKMFASYDQQDSHEFLVILIDILHSELQFPMDDTILNENMNKSEVAWREFLKNMQSIIHSMFFGQIRSTVKCRSCKFESATYEGFSHLSLELPQDNRQCDIYDCLDLYFDGEVIEGWTCPQCKQNREAIKKLDISRLPPVLVIHLKRFYASLDTPNTYHKKPNYVHFPTNDFQIKDYITNSLKQRLMLNSYDLFAVSNHYGTMNRGHYTAFCKNAKSQAWYKYDDNYVTQIASNDVNSSAGYILFYYQQ